MSAAAMNLNGAPGIGINQESIKEEFAKRFTNARSTANVGMTEQGRQKQTNMVNDALAMIAKTIWAIIMAIIGAIKRFFGLDSKDKKDKEAAEAPMNKFAQGNEGATIPGMNWSVEDGDKASAKKSTLEAEGDVLDGDYIRPVHEGAALGTPTYLLGGREGEEALKQKATEMVLGMVYKQMDDPEVMKKVNDLIDEGKTGQLTTEIIGPAFEYFRDHSETLKRSISEDLWDIVGEQVSNPIDRDAAINEIVESLPVVNSHHSMLGQDIINKVISHLQTKVKDIEDLASFKAMSGASAGILAGTFDPLREAQGSNDAPHIQTDFKFHRKSKRGAEENLDVEDVSLNQHARPRQ